MNVRVLRKALRSNPDNVDAMRFLAMVYQGKGENMDDAEALMPNYLRFVKGVIDSADLPLNVSREILQSDRDIVKIKTAAVKRVLDEHGK